MKLSKSELAAAFNVSLNTISNWKIRGCPCLSAGGPGKPSVFLWQAVQKWAYEFKVWPDFEDPDTRIGAAFYRAKAIVNARNKRTIRKKAR